MLQETLNQAELCDYLSPVVPGSAQGSAWEQRYWHIALAAEVQLPLEPCMSVVVLAGILRAVQAYLSLIHI